MPAPVKGSDPVHDEVLLSVRQLGKNWKREHFPAGLLRLGQLAVTVTEMSKSRLQVDAKGVINLGWNAPESQVLLKFIAALGADSELVVNMVEPVA
jgi:hypothetical protein